jgi:acetyltransferase-like isoleucine patch superfamily enzyme
MRALIRKLLYRPSGVLMGADSQVMRPRWLYNPGRIRSGARCFVGRFATLFPMTEYKGVQHDGRIQLGDDVYIGGYCQLHCVNLLTIGSGSVLREHVYVSDVAHGMNPSTGPIMARPLESKGAVTRGEHVFAGFGAFKMPGVELGDHSVVGARSVVARSFSKYSMVAGSPACLIKTVDVL